MKRSLLKNTWLTLALLLAVTAKANTCKFYFLISGSDCNNDLLSKALKSSPRLLKEGSFLFSGDSITKEKAINDIRNIFGPGLHVTVNKALYHHISEQHFKNPAVVIYDSIEMKCITSFPISEIGLKQDVIDYYLDLHKTFRHRIIRNKYIGELKGCRNMDKTGNKLIINAAESKSRVYIFDLKTQALDSIFLTDDLLQNLYKQAGYNADLKKQQAYLREHHLPASPVSFFPNGCTNEDTYYSMLDVFYYDPEDSALVMLGDDTAYINPGKIAQYFVSYNTRIKSLDLQPFGYWRVPSSASPFDRTPPLYKQDFHYITRFNDSTWITSGNKASQSGKEFCQTKLLLKFVRTDHSSTGTSKWIFSGSYDSIYIDSMYSYKGTPMDESQITGAFDYKPPYLYHNESPLVFNWQTNKLLDLTDYEKDINWTFDVQYTDNLLHVLVQRYRKGVFRYTFNRADHSLAGIQMVSAEKDAEMRSIIEVLIAGENPDHMKYQSNLLLDGNSIYHLDKSGDIVVLEK